MEALEAVEEIVSEDGAKNSFAISRGAGRPPFEVTEANKELVLALAINGATADDVSDCLHISKPTLSKYFAEELEEGRALAKAKVARSLYRRAINADDKTDKGAVTAAIFYLKTRAGWKEEKDPQPQGPTVNLVLLGQLPPETLRRMREELLETQAKQLGEGE